MMTKVTKIMLWVICLCLHITIRGQALIVNPSSIHIEETASNWQTAVITGFILEGSYLFSKYQIIIPKLEIGMPIQLSETHDHEWILKRTATKAIAWAADLAAYNYGSRFMIDRSYYNNYNTVKADFKRDFLRYLGSKIPGSRAQYTGIHTPAVSVSKVAFISIPYLDYLIHLGIEK